MAFAVILDAGAGVTWQELTPAPKPEVMRQKLKLVVASELVLTIPGITRVAIGDSEIADVKTIGNDQLLVVGAGPGTTSLIVWTKATPPADLGRLEWDVTVAGGAAAPAPPEESSTVKLRVGAQRVVTLPDVVRIAVGDSSIADVKTIGNDQILVVGKSRGATTMLAWTRGGEQRAWTLRVESDFRPTK